MESLASFIKQQLPGVEKVYRIPQKPPKATYDSPLAKKGKILRLARQIKV